MECAPFAVGCRGTSGAWPRACITHPETNISPHPPSEAPSTRQEPSIAERMRWLLHLRWLIVPVFVAVDLVSDLLLGDPAPWSAIGIGAALLAANGAYAALLARRPGPVLLLRWARVESALVVSLPVLVTVLHHDASSPVRYGVLVGVVGARSEEHTSELQSRRE